MAQIHRSPVPCPTPVTPLATTRPSPAPCLVSAACTARIARKGTRAPVQATQRWHVERTHAWQNAFHRLARCYERRISVIEGFFDLADAIITARSLIH